MNAQGAHGSAVMTEAEMVRQALQQHRLDVADVADEFSAQLREFFERLAVEANRSFQSAGSWRLS